jgi:hypothetical protein
MTDDNYERGNFHYNGRVAGRYASARKNEDSDLGDELVSAIPRVMPTLMANYVLLRTADRLSEQASEAFLRDSGPPATDPMELKKAAAVMGVPGALVSGFLGAMRGKPPQSLLGMLFR